MIHYVGFYLLLIFFLFFWHFIILYPSSLHHCCCSFFYLFLFHSSLLFCRYFFSISHCWLLTCWLDCFWRVQILFVAFCLLYICLKERVCIYNIYNYFTFFLSKYLLLYISTIIKFKILSWSCQLYREHRIFFKTFKDTNRFQT